MTEAHYDTIKKVLTENERLFAKLHKVAQEYDAIDFDESGFYDEEVERSERHWDTLSRKLLDALDAALESAEVRLLKNSAPNVCTLRFDIIIHGKDEQVRTTRLHVDYATEGQIAISREQ